MILKTSKVPIFIGFVFVIIGVAIVYQTVCLDWSVPPRWVNYVMIGFGVLALCISFCMFGACQSRLTVSPGEISLSGTMGWRVTSDQVESIAEDRDSDGDYSGVLIITKAGKRFLIPTWLCGQNESNGVIAVFLDKNLR
jgi:hypothetical protein